MNTSRLLYITGMVISFFASLLVYIKTIAPTVPFWDGGEFIAASYTLGVPHPPGSPLYILIGRLFSILPVMESNIAWRVNFSSSLFSALTVLMVYLTIVKIVTLGQSRTKWSLSESLIIYSGGLTGALLLAFSDTFWFNAVEAEVYALSMLIMSGCSWLTLHWIERNGEKGSERYLFLIAYLVFLGIAIHMFTLLVAPAVFLCAMITDKTIGSNKKVIALFAVMGLIMSSVVASIDAFLVTMPLTILGLILIRGKVPWTYFMGPILLALLIMFFGAEGAGGFNSQPLVVIGGFEATWATTMFSIILVSIALALISASAKDPGRYKWQFWVVILSLAAIGYSVNFYVPIRSAQQPVINENNPSNWKNFEGFLERKQYGQESMFVSMLNRKGSWSSQFGNGEHMGFWRFFSRQFGNPEFPFWLFPVLLAGLGLITQIERDKRSALYLGLMFLICSAGLILYMNFSDGSRGIQREVRERDYFFTPAFLFTAMLMGAGIVAALNQIKAWLQQMNLPGKAVTMSGAILVLALPLVPFNYHYTSHTREGNYIPYDYAYNILQSCDENGILFTNGDNDTFTLWFLQEVEGIRKDVRVVNLSLLNTNWYIKQLKNKTPQVPIAFPDEAIDRLIIQLWEDKEVNIGGIKWNVPKAGALPDGRGYLRVQDMMILHILEQNNWEKPVFFAVTVSPDNKVGLTDFLQMEGMVFRVTKNKGRDQMDLDRTHHNLWEVYKYRGVADSTVYKDAQTSNLLRNYSAAFQQLAVMRWRQGQIDQAVTEMKKYMTLNITNGHMERLLLTQFHANAGQYDQAEPYASELAEQFNTFDGYMVLVDAYRNKRHTTEGLALLERGLAAYPQYPKGYEQLAKLYFQERDTTSVIETLERWLQITPGDTIIQQSITELRQGQNP
jgi:tetratricopeptide (TPR) repeat protein